jgi:hypothetical protein
MVSLSVSPNLKLLFFELVSTVNSGVLSEELLPQELSKEKIMQPAIKNFF